MEPYIHIVHYYETDKMGITHHSNYIRWMEEARIDFLEKAGFSYAKLEEDGVISPVVSVSCNYKRPSTFSDTIEITTAVKEFKGVKLVLDYIMKNQSGTVVCEAESVHCFTDASGRPINVKNKFPELFTVLNNI